MTWRDELSQLMADVEFVEAEIDIGDRTPSATDGDKQYHVGPVVMGRRQGSILAPPQLFCEVWLFLTDEIEVDLTRQIEIACPDNWLLAGSDSGVQVTEITDADDDEESWHVYTCVLGRIPDAGS